MALADDYYTDQARTAQSTAAAIALIWQNLDPRDLDGSWTGMRLVLAGVITQAQLDAALLAEDFLTAILNAGQVQPEPLATIPAAVWAGRAADGRDLATLLDLSLIDVKVRIGQGMDLKHALTSGLYRAQLAGHTETQDAGRLALGSAMTLEPKVPGYTRHVTLPACGRCIVLSGKFYRYSQGFLRHPRCDCVHVPALISNPHVPGPRGLFDRLDPAQQDKAVGTAGAESIRAGADVGQVVNAKRGMATAGASTTTEGTTKRGYAGRKLKGTTRPSPAALLAAYGSDRRAYAAALVSNGYVVS